MQGYIISEDEIVFVGEAYSKVFVSDIYQIANLEELECNGRLREHLQQSREIRFQMLA